MLFFFTPPLGWWSSWSSDITIRRCWGKSNMLKIELLLNLYYVQPCWDKNRTLCSLLALVIFRHLLATAAQVFVLVSFRLFNFATQPSVLPPSPSPTMVVHVVVVDTIFFLPLLMLVKPSWVFRCGDSFFFGRWWGSIAHEFEGLTTWAVQRVVTWTLGASSLIREFCTDLWMHHFYQLTSPPLVPYLIRASSLGQVWALRVPR